MACRRSAHWRRRNSREDWILTGAFVEAVEEINNEATGTKEGLRNRVVRTVVQHSAMMFRRNQRTSKDTTLGRDLIYAIPRFCFDICTSPVEAKPVVLKMDKSHRLNETRCQCPKCSDDFTCRDVNESPRSTFFCPYCGERANHKVWREERQVYLG